MTVDLSDYTRQIFDRFEEFGLGFDSLRTTNIPVAMDHNTIKPPKDDRERAGIAHLPFRDLLGCIHYLADRTRPDLAPLANFAVRHVAEPSWDLWKFLVHGMRYLKKT